MKIIIDDKIPYIRDAVSEITADAVYLKGSEITAADVRDADAMIVRTRTRCDESLLGGSRVQFIATATIGFDHLDTAYLERAGIEWVNCPGCNSGSVAQYLRSALILLKREKGVNPAASTVGIVGYGHVGKKVAREARAMGFRVIVSDPPLELAGSHEEPFASLEQIEREADIITFHVPLTRGGDFPTQHLADASFFSRLRRRPWIVNTSRGPVVDNAALEHALDEGTAGGAIIDTWEGEPGISLSLLNKVYIGTPHIAGYSADGKTNADNMAVAALCRHFGIDKSFNILPPPLPGGMPGLEGDDLLLSLYNPLQDSRRLKADPSKFEELRGNYPLRREKM